MTIDDDDYAPQRAADGGVMPGACNTAGQFITSLEDGQFDADLFRELQRMAGDLSDHAMANSGKAKGKISITIDVVQEAQVVQLAAKFKITGPEEKRPRSVMWLTDDNRFTRSRPNQKELFGIRDVSGTGAVRTA